MGNIFRDFCTRRNIAAQVVIRGEHQSLAPTDRTHAHLRGIMGHISGHGDLSGITYRDWGSQASMDTIHFASTCS